MSQASKDFKGFKESNYYSKSIRWCPEVNCSCYENSLRKWGFAEVDECRVIEQEIVIFKHHAANQTEAAEKVRHWLWGQCLPVDFVLVNEAGEEYVCYYRKPTVEEFTTLVQPKMTDEDHNCFNRNAAKVIMHQLLAEENKHAN